MKIYRPICAAEFQCNGASCGSRCCRDWHVVVDDRTREKFSALPEDDREDFFRHVTELNGAHVLRPEKSGACPFLDENFLCRLQLKHGEEFLPEICQSFPRVTYKLDDEIFLQTLTLTCPVAAKKILLRKEPITFEVVDKIGARMVFDYTTKFLKPVEEFLRGQHAAIKILQRRELSINERLKELCEFFGEKISVPVEFDAASNAAALVEIFGEMYSANLSVGKKNRLVEIYLTSRAEILSGVYRAFGHVAENYLVNEFFMRLYPCAFVGDEKFNVRVFVTAWRMVEFATVLRALSQSQLSTEDFLELLCVLSDKLDHSRGGMEAIKKFAALHDAEIFYALMIDGQIPDPDP